ncbi:MAG TPA: rRNA maturation RNase YbeY [Microvirga sp.]|nr:rRNA maturation RNase YbeY [Microvirga sp.]
MSDLDLDVAVEGGAWSELGDAEALARRAVEAALGVASDAPRGPVEVSLLLTDDAGVRALNAAWRAKDRPTNVLSFPAPAQPGVPGPRHLGDIALAFETLQREAREEGKTLADHAAHLVVHGTLHLLGYDHEGTGEAEIMEALEVKALMRLGIADPYRDTEPAGPAA